MGGPDDCAGRAQGFCGKDSTLVWPEPEVYIGGPDVSARIARDLCRDVPTRVLAGPDIRARRA